MKIFIAILLWLTITLLYNAFAPHDSTDPKGGGRSGLGLKIDHGTGCHYLTAAWGGVTPRLDAQGKQICREEDK